RVPTRFLIGYPVAGLIRGASRCDQEIRMSVRRRLALRSWLLPLWLAAGVGSAMVPAYAEVTVVGTTADSRSASVNEAAGRDDAAQLKALQHYIGDKYQVPLKAVKSVIEAARDVGQSRQLDPLLLL